MPGSNPFNFQSGWEPLLWFVKPHGDLWMDKRAIAAPSAGAKFSKVTWRKASNEHLTDSRKGYASVEVVLPNTLWDYGHVGGGQAGAPDVEAEGHPARWPYRLAEDILRCFCPPDGLACDPFLGAGTSAVAAFEHGRRFIGGDLGTRTADPARGLDAVPWVEVAARVLDARSKQIRMFGPGAA